MSSRAALTAIAPWVRVMIASRSGSSSTCSARACSRSPASTARDHRGVPVGGDVRDDRDDAGGADRQPGEVERVVAAVVGQVGVGHHAGALEQVALGVLDRRDPRVLGRAGAGCRRGSGCRCGPGCRRASPGRPVASATAWKCATQALLRRLVVVRRHDEQAVGAGLLGRRGQLDGVGGVVGADAGDDPGPVADRLEDGAQQVVLLARAGGGRLPGRAADDQAVAAVVDEVGGQARPPRRGRGRRPRRTG